MKSETKRSILEVINDLEVFFLKEISKVIGEDLQYLSVLDIKKRRNEYFHKLGIVNSTNTSVPTRNPMIAPKEIYKNRKAFFKNQEYEE